MVGPTGCGKTHLVKSIAYGLHGDMNKLLRIDCGEYQSKHEVAKLIGAPPGYLGHGDTKPVLDPERISNLVSEHSNVGVILFDEVEKADQEFYDILLGALDYAVITLGTGEDVKFNNILFFFTSNLGTKMESAQPNYIFNPASSKSTSNRRAKRQVKQFFRAEFLNRLNQQFYLNPLTVEECVGVAEFELKRLLASSPYTYDIDKGLYQTIVDMGWSSEFGARSLRRVIEDKILQPLSEIILSNDLDIMSSTIQLSSDLTITSKTIDKKKGVHA